MSEESLSMVMFRQLHSAGIPDKPQTHLLMRKFLGPLHTGVMALGLQVDVQQQAQVL